MKPKYDRKYSPEDFDSPLREDMERAYDLYEKGDHGYLHGAVVDIYFDVKAAVKFKEIEPGEGKKIQGFFWGLMEDG